MKFSWDEKHFPLLNYFIVRNNPQTAMINIRKKRIAEKIQLLTRLFVRYPYINLQK